MEPGPSHRPEDVASAYWAAWRGSGDFTESWAWSLLADAIDYGDGDVSVPVLQAMWQRARADDERRWVVTCLQDVLHLAPHRTPARVLEAVAEDADFAAALELVDVADLPLKAQRALGRTGR